MSHFVVEIELTTACTRNCPFCRPTLLPEDRDFPAYLTEKLHSKLIGELASVGWDKWIVYCGHGEPTMHPKILGFLLEARRRLPNAKLALATNGDNLTAEFLRSAPLDCICWDCYDNDATAARMGDVVRESGFPPEKFAVIDFVNWRKLEWLSRAGTGFKSDRAGETRHKPCLAPQRKIFFSARGRFSLCCNDGHRRVTWDCTLPELLKDAKYIQAQTDLAQGNREPYAPCVECEYAGAPPEWPDNGLVYFYPSLDKTRFWRWNAKG